MRPGESIEVTVEKGVYRGQGLARHGGQVVLVSRGQPGDRVRVRLEAVTSGYARGVAEAILEPGPGRRDSPCPFFASCGGCAYQDLDYGSQLQLKEAILRESLARAGVQWSEPIRLRPSPEDAWRTRAAFHLEEVAGEWRLGLHSEGTRRVVDLETCRQLSPAMNRAQRALRQALGARPDRARRVRDVALAEPVEGGSLVASLEGDLDVDDAAALAGLGDGLPWLTGLGAVVGRGRGSHFVSLRGEPWTESTIRGLRLRAHVRSFFQSNRFLVGDLVQDVLDLLPDGGTVLDLYAGVGLFALSLAARADSVLGVELNATAVEDARHNAARAGLDHARFRQGDALAAVGSWPATSGERVVLDPPRTGAGPGLVRALAGRRPAAIVYVSCDPPTLARDVKTFEAHGYRLDAVRALDLFPDTFHLETVARLIPGSPPPV